MSDELVPLRVIREKWLCAIMKGSAGFWPMTIALYELERIKFGWCTACKKKRPRRG